MSSVEPEGQEEAGLSDSPPRAILDQHWEQRSDEFTLESCSQPYQETAKYAQVILLIQFQFL